MNAADQNLLNWLKREINTGKTKIVVPAYLLENTTPEGLADGVRTSIVSILPEDTRLLMKRTSEVLSIEFLEHLI